MTERGSSQDASHFTAHVAALGRGLAILRCFQPTRTDLSVTEIARLTALPQPTVWRLCQTLLAANFLALSPSGQKLRIGFAGLALGYAAVATFDVGEIALEEMQQLANEFHAASSMAAPDLLEMIIVRRATAADSLLIVNLHVGSRLQMATSSSGWAYLAALPKAEQSRLLRRLADHHGPGWPALRSRIDAALALYEERGYVLNLGVYGPDINSVGVPIAPDDGGRILSLNLGGPAALLTAARLEKEVAPRLLQVAATIRAALAIKSAERRGERVDATAVLQSRTASSAPKRARDNWWA